MACYQLCLCFALHCLNMSAKIETVSCGVLKKRLAALCRSCLQMWGFACAYCVLFRRDQEHEVRLPHNIHCWHKTQHLNLIHTATDAAT
jgi:hypothetical protein